MEEIAESDLVEQAKTDPEAFGLLYEANYSPILDYIYRCTLDVALAEELTSNTFFKAFRALPKYRPHSAFRIWLYRIATNEIRMHHRSQRRHRVRQGDALWQKELHRIRFASRQEQTSEDREEKMRQYTRLHHSLRSLPERYQSVLILRYFEGLPYHDIAKVTGRSVGTVKSLVHRGLKRLRQNFLGRGATFGPDRHYIG